MTKTPATPFEIFSNAAVQAYLARNSRLTLAFSVCAADGLWYCDLMSGFAQTYEVVRSFEAANAHELARDIVRYCEAQLRAQEAADQTQRFACVHHNYAPAAALPSGCYRCGDCGSVFRRTR